MNKRGFEDVFQTNGMLDILGNTPFKMLCVEDPSHGRPGTCRQQFLNAKMPDHNDSNNYLHYSVDELASLTDIEILDAARTINHQTNTQMSQPAYMADLSELRKRDIRKISVRRLSRAAKPTPEPVAVNPGQMKPEIPVDQDMSFSAQESTSQADTQSENAVVDLQAISQERIKVDYLDQMTKHCGLQITQEQANQMSQLTDRLTEILVERESQEVHKITSENELLKKAYRIQAQILQQMKTKRSTLMAQVQDLKQELENLLQDNAEMEEFLQNEPHNTH